VKVIENAAALSEREVNTRFSRCNKGAKPSLGRQINLDQFHVFDRRLI
jgi:hypothetical protein